MYCNVPTDELDHYQFGDDGRDFADYPIMSMVCPDPFILDKVLPENAEYKTKYL